MATTLKKKPEGKSEKSDSKPKDDRLKLSDITTPVPPKDRDGDRFGASWGLRLDETFIKMLEENENPKKGHKTDDDMIQFLLSEFPNKHNKNILYNIREIRWRYNTGRLNKDENGEPQPPESMSIQYDSDGTPRQKRAAKSGMSPEELAMKTEERQALEHKRRAEEDASIAKLQERIDKTAERVEARRKAWEAKNGELPDQDVEEEEEKVEEKPKKKLKKIK